MAKRRTQKLAGTHSLVGTWQDADQDYGSMVQFTIRASGGSFKVTGVDTHDGERLSISKVRWDGRVLRFTSLVPSTRHRGEYAFEAVSSSEVLIRYTVAERWIRSEPTM